ncbi:transcriptional regulator with XRE-family HTH domain [Allocatelliglobosispora scoriae]|uniref:Transcriptional regulator with XRE-family HTH domain n=1 Tax=Allocatelliglobosispora scoriae TaxID=643052 RepID=A0A841BJ11_9ACTN|nr:hypothetical protein [Allocatelliglobosispora scoriae]MBB5867186.1 transcriptional regulator with XRE-family HTH domain [Allocatelliglobosispora scoriae]
MSAAFGAALRVAIQRSGRSLHSIADELRERSTPVSPSTLSCWQNGDSQPERSRSLAALANVERIVGVPAGSLVDKLGPRRPRGSWRPRTGDVPFEHFWDSPESLVRTLAKLDATPEDTYNPHRVSTFSSYQVDHHGQIRSLRTRRLVRADRDGASRIIFPICLSTLTEPPQVVHTDGCAPARFRVDVASSTCVFEFRLDRPLRAGELASIEIALRYPAGQAEGYVRLDAFRPPRDLTIQVAFDPARLPARCYGYVQPHHARPKREVSGGSVAQPPHTLQFITMDPAPGAYGVGWEW